MNGSSRMLTLRLFFCELKGCYSWLWNCWDALCTPLEKTLAEIWLVDEQAAVCTFRRANRLFDDTWLKYTSGKTNGGLSHGWLRREVIDDSTLRAMQCREVEVKGCCWEDEGRFWADGSRVLSGRSPFNWRRRGWPLGHHRAQCNMK